jgi:hypothetical protein
MAAPWPRPRCVNQVLFRVWYASHPGEPVQLTIQRPGEAQPLVITPVFRAAVGSGDMQSLARRGAVEVLGFYPLLFLVVGLAVLFLRLEDSNAWLLALMFAGFITEADVAAAFGAGSGCAAAFPVRVRGNHEEPASWHSSTSSSPFFPRVRRLIASSRG